MTPLSPEPAPRAQETPVSTESLETQKRITAMEDLILARLDDDQAQDVVFIDLKGKSAMADGLVVASGRSHRHVGAIADHLLRALKERGYGRARVEGTLSAHGKICATCTGTFVAVKPGHPAFHRW